jgi:Sec-independent protein translocase protein TatA
MGSDLGGAVKGFKDGMKDGASADTNAHRSPSTGQVANQPSRRQDHHRRASQAKKLSSSERFP